MSVNCGAMAYPKQREEWMVFFGVIHFVAYKLKSSWVFPGLIIYHSLHCGLWDEFTLVPAMWSTISSSSHWNVGQRKLAAETSKIKVFPVWWLLSWDRQRGLCLAGVEEIRDQREVLQRSLIGDTSVLHLKPGEKWIWVRDKTCILQHSKFIKYSTEFLTSP